MILKDGWHYLALKKLSALLHEIHSRYKCEFSCLNTLFIIFNHYFRTENKLKSRGNSVQEFFEL